MSNAIVDNKQWVEARTQLLAKEKAFTRAGDEVAKARRELPWVRVDKAYVFEGPSGPISLEQLFDGRSQLIVYHFMFGPEWKEGCKSCSFWADNFERNVVHLGHRDATLIAISRAPIATLSSYRERFGWSFQWVSALDNDFNFDFGVSFDPKHENATYNYRPKTGVMTELPGISVFCRNESGEIFHTYSTYGRGLEMMNAAFHYLDLLPKGRDEETIGPMGWLRRRDEYDVRT